MEHHHEPPQAGVMRVIAGYWLSQAGYVAARLKIADAVGNGNTALGEIAQATGTRPDSLKRTMRALTSHGFFHQDETGAFFQTPLSETLRSGRPESMRAIAEAELGHDHYQSWGELESCLREGGTAFERKYGMPVWHYYAKHPELEALFGEAMSNLTDIANKGIVHSYEFAPFSFAIDIGGGHGGLLSSVLERHPQARGMIFDLPTVIDEAATGDAVARHRGRLETSAGDFFEKVPSGGDLYLLKFILHDWNDDQCVTILSNIRKAMSPSGRLAVIEIVLPERSEPHVGPLIDLNMMVMTGGRERTKGEYGTLLSRAGFRLQNTVGTKSPFSVIEAVPV